MAKKFLTLDLQTGKKQLETTIVDREFSTEEKKPEVAYSATAVDSLLKEVDGDITLAEEFKVTGVNVGNFTDGTVISAGTSVLELLQKMLQKQIPPVYNRPSASITATGSGNVEAGTRVTPTVVSKFNKADAGEITKYVLRKNGEQIKDVTSLENFVEQEQIQIGDGKSLRYDATISYDNGPIKNDNFNSPYPNTSIKAGSVNTGEVSFTGYRKYFYKTDSETSTSLSSTDIRNLTGSTSAAGANTKIRLVIPKGGRRAVFAYPDTVRDVSSVKYVELGNGEVKDTFQKFTVQVEGANGYSPINYKVYVYVSAVPAAGQMTYEVTI